MPKVPNHAHCRVCGHAIPSGDTYCSAGCKQEAEEDQKKRRRMLYLLYAAFGVSMLVIIGQSFL